MEDDDGYSEGESASAASLEPNELEKIGSICVSVYRAQRMELATPKGRTCKRPAVFDDVPKKSLKGKAIMHNVK